MFQNLLASLRYMEYLSDVAPSTSSCLVVSFLVTVKPNCSQVCFEGGGAGFVFFSSVSVI